MKTFFVCLFMITCSDFVFAQRSIDSTWSFNIDGIHQWVSAKGKNVSNPILLWINGGPGSASIGQADKYTQKLEDRFVVIHWDQRGTGKTETSNTSAGTFTLQQFYDDTRNLVDSLLHHFHHQKLYIAGYSWGTALGFYMAGKYAEKLYGYIAISPLINQEKSEWMTLRMLRENANTKKEKQELASVTIPFVTGEQLFYARKWLAVYNGNGLARLSINKRFVISWAEKWLPVFNEASAVNTPELLPKINCPIYFLVGRNDNQTQHILAEEYYNQLIAPKKDFFWFEESGHTLADTETDAMQETIINEILPETYSNE